MKKILTSILFMLISIAPIRANSQELSIFGDVLYWHASEQATSIWSNQVSSQGSTLRFSPADFNFEWSPGFRGGFMYEPQNHFLDTKLYWTYFSTNNNSNYRVANKILIPEFFSGFLSGNFFFGATTNWKIVMNTVDLEESHKFKLSNSFTFNPAIGIKAASINQTINSNWDAVIYNATEQVKNNYFGVGPRFGINATWNFYDTLNLVGNFSTALMWGNWKVNDTYMRPSLPGLITATTISTTMNPSMLGTTMLGYFIGLEWAHPKKMPLTFMLGYEMQAWQNQFRIPTFQQLPVHGDLTFQGATCGLKIDL